MLKQRVCLLIRSNLGGPMSFLLPCKRKEKSQKENNLSPWYELHTGAERTQGERDLLSHDVGLRVLSSIILMNSVSGPFCKMMHSDIQ